MQNRYTVMKKATSNFAGFTLWIILFLFSGCNNNNVNLPNKEGSNLNAEKSTASVTGNLARTDNTTGNYKVTFIELGSVRCIPCQKMQKVMKSIEEKFAGQVKVEFYDVWTPEGKPMGDKYGIKLIPTQIFLDKEGREFYRHEGFFPEEELIKVLKKQGVK
ncbi:MAG: thioredoxin family protein [Bacteroidales bacterium]